MPLRSMLDNFFSSQRPLFSLSDQVWNPPTDIFETPQATVIRMEVAGLDEQQLNITAQQNVLNVQGRRALPNPQEPVNFHLMEIHHGHFQRTFQFSFTLNKDEIKASYERGFLLIELQRPDSPVTRVSVEILGELGGPEKNS